MYKSKRYSISTRWNFFISYIFKVLFRCLVNQWETNKLIDAEMQCGTYYFEDSTKKIRILQKNSASPDLHSYSTVLFRIDFVTRIEIVSVIVRYFNGGSAHSKYFATIHTFNFVPLAVVRISRKCFRSKLIKLQKCSNSS